MILLAGKYRVIEKIRDGGMGTLYKAEDTRSGQAVAIKTLRASLVTNEEARKRFLREARIAERLSHPNLVSVLGVVEEDSAPLIVMEFLPGKNVNEELETHRPLPCDDAGAITLETLEGLAYLHEKGVVHRDVSPENIMVERIGKDRLSVKLIDFGIARDWTEESATASALFVGKVRYSSPEQLGAIPKSTPIDGRSDIYSLGCVLYLMVTGEPPVVASTPAGYIMAHIQEGARPFEETDPRNQVPEALRAVILRAMARNRDDRYRTASEFSEALRRALPSASVQAQTLAEAEKTQFLARDGASRPASPTTHPPSAKKALMVTAIATTAMLAAAAGLWVFTKRNPLPGQPAPHPLVPSPAVTAIPASSPPGPLVLTSSPWARVVSVVPEGNPIPLLLGDLETPARLDLPPGKYLITLRAGPGGFSKVEKTVTVDVPAPSGIHIDLAADAVERAVEAFLK